MTEISHRPTALGSALAVLAALASVRLVAAAPPQLPPLAVAAVAVVLLGLGAAVRERDRSDAGWFLVGVGALAAFTSVGFAWTAPETFGQKVVLLPGVVGVGFVACALVPVRSGWERRLLAVGVAWLVVGLLVASVMQEAGRWEMLGSMATVVLAWDAGKQAVSLGEQVGRGATTRSVEVLHVGASGVVGALAVAAAVGVYDLDVTGFSLAGLALLLGGAITLAVALYH